MRSTFGWIPTVGGILFLSMLARKFAVRERNGRDQVYAGEELLRGELYVSNLLHPSTEMKDRAICL